MIHTYRSTLPSPSGHRHGTTTLPRPSGAATGTFRLHRCRASAPSSSWFQSSSSPPPTSRLQLLALRWLLPEETLPCWSRHHIEPPVQARADRPWHYSSGGRRAHAEPDGARDGSARDDGSAQMQRMASRWRPRQAEHERELNISSPVAWYPLSPAPEPRRSSARWEGAHITRTAGWAPRRAGCRRQWSRSGLGLAHGCAGRPESCPAAHLVSADSRLSLSLSADCSRTIGGLS